MANCCHVYDISAVTATVGVGHWVQLANASQPISQSKQIYIFLYTMQAVLWKTS